ncbi:MAG: AI-2E family transporter [Nitritalea sp.]
MKKFILYLLLIIGCLMALGWYFSTISFYFILSLVIAAVLRPVTNRVNAVHILGQHIPRWLAILFSFGVIVGLLFGIVLLFVPLISIQIERLGSFDLDVLYEQIQNPVGRVEDFLITYNLVNAEPGFLIIQVRETLIGSVGKINVQGLINTVFSTTSSFFIAVISVAFITFFLLLENGLLRRNILNLVPNAYFELSVATFNKVERLLSNYLIGLLFQITSIFTIAGLGLTFVGVEYGLTIAFFAAVANLIPYAGPVLGATFGLLVGVSTMNFAESGEFVLYIARILIVFGLVQLIDNVLLQPLIFSKSVKAHPLEIFVIIFVGAKVAGILGMIFAIPVYTIFRVSIIEFYKGYRAYRIFKLSS